jgi:ArsR family transcriptional regulator
LHIVRTEIKREKVGRLPMKTTGYDREAQLFAALAHPVRLRMLEVLAEAECCVCHLSHALGRKQAYISQQLARLKEAGLILDTRDGLFVYYRLADPRILQLLIDARRTMALPGAVERLAARKHSAGDCPCPKCQQERERAGQKAREAPTAQVTAGTNTGGTV